MPSCLLPLLFLLLLLLLLFNSPSLGALMATQKAQMLLSCWWIQRLPWPPGKQRPRIWGAERGRPCFEHARKDVQTVRSHSGCVKVPSLLFTLLIFTPSGDATYLDIFREFSHMASHNPEKLKRRSVHFRHSFRQSARHLERSNSPYLKSAEAAFHAGRGRGSSHSEKPDGKTIHQIFSRRSHRVPFKVEEMEKWWQLCDAVGRDCVFGKSRVLFLDQAFIWGGGSAGLFLLTACSPAAWFLYICWMTFLMRFKALVSCPSFPPVAFG